MSSTKLNYECYSWIYNRKHLCIIQSFPNYCVIDDLNAITMHVVMRNISSRIYIRFRIDRISWRNVSSLQIVVQGSGINAFMVNPNSTKYYSSLKKTQKGYMTRKIYHCNYMKWILTWKIRFNPKILTQTGDVLIQRDTFVIHGVDTAEEGGLWVFLDEDFSGICAGDEEDFWFDTGLLEGFYQPWSVTTVFASWNTR